MTCRWLSRLQKQALGLLGSPCAHHRHTTMVLSHMQ